MKQATNLTSAARASLIAGALCTALLSGCGSMTSIAAPSAGTSAISNATESEAATSNALAASSDFLTCADAYSDLVDFQAQTLDGKTFTRKDLAKADVTIINFWSPYCGYCVAEMPDIAAWEKTLPANVQLITVCVDYESDPASAKEIIRECGFESVTLVSGSGDYVNLTNDVAFLPTTIVVDSSGKVVGSALEGMAQDVPTTLGLMADEALQAQGKATLETEGALDA